MKMTRFIIGVGLAGLLLVVGCSDDSSGGNTACESLCDNVADCAASLPDCSSTCEGAVDAAFASSSACGNAFESVANCAGNLGCEQLEDLVSGGDECQSEIQACDQSCGAGVCDFD
ncbi:MAG: hypothetical protein AAGF92_14205 [Myxococcota bacterium]